MCGKGLAVAGRGKGRGVRACGGRAATWPVLFEAPFYSPPYLPFAPALRPFPTPSATTPCCVNPMCK